MAGNKLLFLSATFLAAVMFINTASAQVSYNSEGKRKSIYFSIGTSKPSYSPSTINITQGRAGNLTNYDLEKVSADNKAAPSGAGLSNNIRVGFFFDHEQHMAIELNYDPASYHVVDGQNVHLKGTVNNNAKDTSFAFAASNGNSYYLNGSNFVMVNFVYRYTIFQVKSHNFKIDALGKVGAGPVMPHVMNTIDGKIAESPSFKVSGWNAGIEAGLRFTFMRHLYLEATPKYSYATYSNLGVYDGTASQKLTTFQTVLSIGYWFSLTKHNPLFQRQPKEKKAWTIRPIHPEPIDDPTN